MRRCFDALTSGDFETALDTLDENAVQGGGQEVTEGLTGRVVEGARHGGDVPERGPRAPPLLEDVPGLALEVDQDPSLAGARHLSEMEIPWMRWTGSGLPRRTSSLRFWYARCKRRA